jgi:phage tail-like protein
MPLINAQIANGKQVFGRTAFKVTIPGIDPVGVFRECQGLEMSFDVLSYREGGNNGLVHHLPTRATYPNLVLSRGMTDEDALLRWFWQTRTQAERKEVSITLYDWSAQKERSWAFGDAFPVRWTGPVLQAEGTDLATESLEIAHSGMTLP